MPDHVIPRSPAVLVADDHGGELAPTRLRAVFGAFPTGVVAVAAHVDGRTVGLAVSSFTSVSLDPPLVSFAIGSTSRSWPSLARATRLGITVLAEHHGAVARQLAGPSETRFTGLNLKCSEHGAVTLTDGLAWFDTSIDRHVQAGDHILVLLRLHAATYTDDALPLVFHRSGFAALWSEDSGRVRANTGQLGRAIP